jgi:hypothetical protein
MRLPSLVAVGSGTTLSARASRANPAYATPLSRCIQLVETVQYEK